MTDTIARKYRGPIKVAQELYEADARKLATDGWTPVATNWQQGTWKLRELVVPGLLCIVLVGFVILIRMQLAGKPGDLLVTYTRGGDALTQECPQCAEEVKPKAKVCRYCGADLT